jgi:6-pyruvoyltetrahydropterin/6-carboxytetrahydropterin synthase
MYEISVMTDFSAAHSLRGYDGKCANVHGHNWRVRVTVRAEEPGADGIAIDFRDLKRLTSEVLDRLDHTYINEVAPFDRINPTSENIACWLCEQLEPRLTSSRVRLVRVDVQENDTSRATFFPD